MPYTIYITRSDINGFIDEVISLPEFRQLVESDPTLVWAEDAELVGPDRLRHIPPKTAAIWVESPTEEKLWFSLDAEGTIPFSNVTDVDEGYLEKIFEVARKLNAHVQNEDGGMLL